MSMSLSLAPAFPDSVCAGSLHHELPEADATQKTAHPGSPSGNSAIVRPGNLPPHVQHRLAIRRLPQLVPRPADRRNHYSLPGLRRLVSPSHALRFRCRRRIEILTSPGLGICGDSNLSPTFRCAKIKEDEAL